MTTLRYVFSFLMLFSVVQLNAQFSIINPQNPDIPYYFASVSDGTIYANGKGIDGDFYYTSYITEFGSYQEKSYFIGAYSGDFLITDGQKFERLAVIQLNGQTLQIDRITSDGTVEETVTYDFPTTFEVTLDGALASRYFDSSIYVSGLEVNAAGEKAIFTIKFDEDLTEIWREDVAVDDSVEEVELVDYIRSQGEDGFLLAYVRPSDFSLQAIYRDFDGSLIWENEVMNSAAAGTIPSLDHSYVASNKAFFYGNYESPNADQTDYFAYYLNAETGEQIFETVTPIIEGSTDYDFTHQVQALSFVPNDQFTYVEAGISYQHHPDGRLYIAQKTLEGHLKWYKEFSFLADVRYVHAHGYIAGMVDGESWFGYFNPFYGNLFKRENECLDNTNLATNACITMSSQMLSGAANNAIDGETSANATTDFAATTTEEYRPWMVLDLGEIYLIDSIKIYPSSNSENAFENTRIYGDLNPIPSDVTRAHMTAEWQYSWFSDIDVSQPFIVSGTSINNSTNFPARYFGLYKLGFGTLEIEEIEIFGCAPSNCEDNDGDGFCFTEDCNDFDALVPALPGTPCDDGNPLTENDVIQNDHCTCVGDANDIDIDGDGIPSSEDCYDYGFDDCSHRLAYTPIFNSGDLDPNTCECVTDLQPFSNQCHLNYRVNGSTLTIHGIQGGGQTGLNLFDANWQIIFSCDANNCNEAFIEITDLPDGDYFLNAQIFSVTGCALETTITIDQNACVDNDGDGICAIDDPDPTNGNIPAAPGTPCNDCNADTENDMIQVDGATCAGTLIACDDADNDDVCADEDCDDNNPNVPATPGTACDDNDPNTENDSIQADGCTCLGEIIPCVDVDEDGICEADDCDDNNANLPTTPGTICDDGDANTENDVIQADGCTCLGEIPCVDLDNDGVCTDDDCDDNDPNLPTTPGTPCSDGDPNTGDDVILADGCTCAGMLIIATDDDDNQAFMGGNTSGNQAEVAKNLVKTKMANQIKLLPNPVNNHLTILFNTNENQDEEIVIYNSNGQVQMQILKQTGKGINSVKVDVSDLPSGVYFVRLKQSGSVERLVKL